MDKKYKYLIVIFLIVASLAAYGRILNNEFVNLDDNQYITENSHIKSGINPESIIWALTTVTAANWHPLTWLAHMLDWILFKDFAGGHHLISLLLHIGTALLLFFFFHRMTRNLWSSAFVAALFALHPLRVESVAWAAERKDVLSMFCGLAALSAYALYAEKNQLSRYFLCLIFFALSLLAKPMLVTLPFIFLLLDYWPLGRWQKEISAPLSRGHLIGRLLGEKIPFLFLTIISSIVTLWAQNKSGFLASMTQVPFPARLANAIISYVTYLEKTFWPVDLAVFYPYQYSFPFWKILVSCFTLIGITIIVIYAIKKLPFLFVGWFWYLGTLLPVIGLVQVGSQSMADRYTYLPSIGIALMLVWGIPLLIKRTEIRQKVLFPAGLVILSILAVLTWQQCGYWKNNYVLFNHALNVTKDNYLAYNSLGGAYSELGLQQRALDYFNEAIRLNPNYAILYYNRGNSYIKIGQYRMAIGDYSKAIGLNCDDEDTYNNRGIAYDKLGQYELAIADYGKAIHLNPNYSDVYINRGIAYCNFGQPQRAIENFDEAIRLNQTDIDAYKNRGIAYFLQYNNNLGCFDAQKACALGNCQLLEWAKGKGYCR